MTIAVLALQGAFIEHEQMLEKLGVSCFEIRQKIDLEKPFDGLIIPGGESKVIGKLLKERDIFNILQKKIKSGLPVFGTCAGLILLAKSIDGDPTTHLATMDIVVKRNAYGRQLGSFFTKSKFGKTEVPMTFIRAPYIIKVGDNVEVLSVVDDKIVAARQNNMLAVAFHPELNSDPTIHKYFIDMIG